MPSTWLYPETSFSLHKGLRGAPQSRYGERKLWGPSAGSKQGSPKQAGARSTAWDVHPAPPARASPTCPAAPAWPRYLGSPRHPRRRWPRSR